jgi:hypothetical protein
MEEDDEDDDDEDRVVQVHCKTNFSAADQGFSPRRESSNNHQFRTRRRKQKRRKIAKSSSRDFPGKPKNLRYSKMCVSWRGSHLCVQVSDFFKHCGEVTSVEIPKDSTGRSSGTAYVTFSSNEAVTQALEMDSQYFTNSERWVKVIRADEKESRPSFGTPKGGKPDGCDTVFIGNLDFNIEEHQVELNRLRKETYFLCTDTRSIRAVR